MRLRNDPQAQSYIDQSDFVIKNFPIKLDQNVILEIGMGKGEMLTELARLKPEQTFIGIEKFPTVTMKAIKKAQKLNLKNFFVINEDLTNLVDAFSGQVEQIWLTFSDPWPKKRHYKRRLTYQFFLKIYQQLLAQNGILKIKTDNDDFFLWSIHQIIKFGAQISFITTDLHQSIKNENNIETGYETKWRLLGKKINYMEVKFD